MLNCVKCAVCSKLYFVSDRVLQKGQGRFCSLSCSTTSHYDEPEIRFWNNVSKLDSGCWLWLGSTNASGYGVFSINNKLQRSHRFSWELHHGLIIGNLQVLHTCDNPPCVNPKHLYLGNDGDNARDRITRNRHVVPIGEEHNSSKLTKQEVLDIRSKAHLISNKKLATMYGVTNQSISDIIKRKTWKHI